jgi:hypothetical protein
MILLLLFSGAVRAEEVQISTTTVSKRPGEFLKSVAAATQIPPDELKVLDKPSLGKMEILVLALLHKKSGADLKILLERRVKGIRLSRLIDEKRQDEREIYEEAWQLRKQIDGK